MTERRWAIVGGLGLMSLVACSSVNEAGPAVAVEPKALYEQMCARCHGSDGRGDPELGKQMPIRDLTLPSLRATLTTEAIEGVIMSGRNQMPAFGAALSPPKIHALAGYVRRLGKQ